MYSLYNWLLCKQETYKYKEMDDEMEEELRMEIDSKKLASRSEMFELKVKVSWWISETPP